MGGSSDGGSFVGRYANDPLEGTLAYRSRKGGIAVQSPGISFSVVASVPRVVRMCLHIVQSPVVVLVQKYCHPWYREECLKIVHVRLVVVHYMLYGEGQS